MRYYAIKITGNNLPSALKPISGAKISGAQFCSVVNGKNDPGALDIEMQLRVSPDHVITSTGNFIRIWGVPLSLIAQSNQLSNPTNEAKIEVYGGMSEGLPLATFQSKEQGLLGSGNIWSAFGNWLGTEITLDLIVVSGGDTSGGSASGSSGSSSS